MFAKRLMVKEDRKKLRAIFLVDMPDNMYKISMLGAVTAANRFQMGNYYSFIDDNVRANNPKIVRQPNQ